MYYNQYMQYPYMQYPYMPQVPGYQGMMQPQYLIRQVRPVVRYGLKEAEVTGVPHAMMEVALITYLMGRGYNFNTARSIVEAWEIDEVFPNKEK